MNERTEINRPIKTNSAFENFLTNNWPMVVFCLIHAVILLCIFQSRFIYKDLHMFRADLNTGYDYASRIIDGCNPSLYIEYDDNSKIIQDYYPYPDMEYSDTSQIIRHCLPYRDFSVEYPPLGMVFITLPRLVVPYLYLYWQAYAIEIFLFDIIGIFVLKALSMKLGCKPWKTLCVYTIAMLTVGPLVVTRFDFIPAVLTLLSIYFFVKRHSKMAWVFLAMATLTKIYPLVIAPIFLLIQLNRKQKKELLGGLAAFMITSAVVIVPCLILSPSGFWDSFYYHAQRPLQIESTYASIIELLSAFKLLTINITNSFGSTNVIGTVPDILAKISFGVTVISLLATYWSVYRSLKNGQMNGQSWSVQTDEIALIIKYCLMAVLVFILACKVLSPQYIIWMLPLIPLITQKSKYVIWLLFVIVGIMTFFIFPKYYEGLRGGSLITIATLVIRNITLVGILLLLIRSRFLKAIVPKRP